MLGKKGSMWIQGHKNYFSAKLGPVWINRREKLEGYWGGGGEGN